jgi:hypothetical protein
MNAIFLLVTMRSWLLGLIVSARVRASAFARVVAACAIRHTNAPGLSIVPCDELGTNARRRNATTPLCPSFSGAVCPPISSPRPLLALILGPAAGALVAARLPVVIQFGVHSAASAATALCIMLATASVGLDVSPPAILSTAIPTPTVAHGAIAASSSPRPCASWDMDFGSEERAWTQFPGYCHGRWGAAPGKAGPQNGCFATGFS